MPHVTLAGDLAGEYLVDEQMADGRLVLRPDTSAQAIRRRLAVEQVPPGVFDEHFGHLPLDSEG